MNVENVLSDKNDTFTFLFLSSHKSNFEAKLCIQKVNTPFLTLPEVQMYLMTGCRHQCGNTISFPYGCSGCMSFLKETVFSNEWLM